MAWWHTEQPDRSTSSFRVAPGARVTAGGVGLKFLLLWINCLCLRSCYGFVSSIIAVGLQLAHWGCHYHSFWTWLLLKRLTKRPNINNHLRSPVSNTREAWKCVLPSCLGGRALAGRLDGPGQENQGHKRGWILVRLPIHTNMLIYQVLLILDIQKYYKNIKMILLIIQV